MDQLLDKIFLLADQPVALFATLFIASLANTFFPPVPIEFGTVFAGYVVSEGHGSLATIIAATALGMSVGGIALYELARHFGAPYFEKRFFAKLMPQALYENTARLVQRHGAWSLLLAKFIPGMNFCAIVCAGLFRMGHGRAYAFITISNLLVFALLAVIGKLAGDHWREAARAFGTTSGIIALAVLAVIAIILLRRARRRATTLE